jgi:hypothetical protein
VLEKTSWRVPVALKERDMVPTMTEKIRVLWPCAILACVIGSIVRDAAAQDANVPRAHAQEIHFSAKDFGEKRPEWELYGVNPDKHVKFEPAGLRITIPAGFDGPMPEYNGRRPRTGVSIGLIAKGDFEITTRFEFLQEPGLPRPDANGTTKVVLEALLPHKNIATITRRLVNNGRHGFNTWTQPGPGGDANISFPAEANHGRLRMVRQGTDIIYFAADGDRDFKLLNQRPFTADDLIDIRLVGTTGDEQCTLDVRLSDLVIRAASIERRRTVPIAKQVVANGPTARALPQQWMLLAAIAALLLLIAAAWFFARRKRGAPVAESTFAFACACGANLKVKSELDGAQVKCPQCGRAVLATKDAS